MKNLLAIFIVSLLFCSCSGSNSSKSQKASQEKMFEPLPIDQDMANAGKEKFEILCIACHKIDEKYIGPPMKGVAEKREYDWILKMLLNPEEMVKTDSIAKQLFIEYNSAPMANQNLTELEARQILEYLRTL